MITPTGTWMKLAITGTGNRGRGLLVPRLQILILMDTQVRNMYKTDTSHAWNSTRHSVLLFNCVCVCVHTHRYICTHIHTDTVYTHHIPIYTYLYTHTHFFIPAVQGSKKKSVYKAAVVSLGVLCLLLLTGLLVLIYICECLSTTPQLHNLERRLQINPSPVVARRGMFMRQDKMW